MRLKLTRILLSISLFFFFSLSSSQKAFGQQCGFPGSDGPATVSFTVNTYFPSAVPDSVAIGATSIALGATSGTTISPGDLVLIIQMQGVRINTSNNDSYGDGIAGIPGSGRSTIGTDFIAGKSNTLEPDYSGVPVLHQAVTEEMMLNVKKAFAESLIPAIILISEKSIVGHKFGIDPTDINDNNGRTI